MNSPLAPFRPFFLFACLGAAGCGQPALDPAVVAEHKTRLTLAEEPDDAQTVLDVRNAMYGVSEAAHVHEDGEEHAAHEHDADDHDADEHADHEHPEGEEHEHAHDDHDHDHAGHDHAHDDAEPVISEMDVVMVGAVGGVPNPSTQSHPEFPFSERQAIFFLADPEAVAEYEEHEHKHAPGEECAFCSANAAEAAHMVAIVQFNDNQGKPLAVDVRDLFDLKEKETVVVRGKAKIAPGGVLIVDATGLYVRR